MLEFAAGVLVGAMVGAAVGVLLFGATIAADIGRIKRNGNNRG